MRSPPGSLATKPPPTPMAKLQDDIQEIDILLEASKRARESVADRSRGLYEEHLATQRKFDQDMQRETRSNQARKRLNNVLIAARWLGQSSQILVTSIAYFPRILTS